MSERTWGFRLSVVDVLVMAAAIGSVALWPDDQPLRWAAPVVAGHFFLFCNVFRINRTSELAWCAGFLLATAGLLLADAFAWSTLLAISLALAALLIAIELRRPRYHGVFARRLNARLEDYLAGRIP